MKTDKAMEAVDEAAGRKAPETKTLQFELGVSRREVLNAALTTLAESSGIASAVLEKTHQLSEKQAALKSREAAIYSEVSQLRGSDNKATFGNEDSRKNESRSRAAEDAICVTLRQGIVELEKNIAAQQAEGSVKRAQVELMRAYLHGGE